MIKIQKGIETCKEEIVFKFSRSSGPGGQNVNKVNTRVTLLFDVTNTTSFSESQKKQILERLATRINKNGVATLSYTESQSRGLNRTVARIAERGVKKQTGEEKNKGAGASSKKTLRRKKTTKHVKATESKERFGQRLYGIEYRGTKKELTEKKAWVYYLSAEIVDLKPVSVSQNFE